MNVNGELRSLVYGRPVTIHIDPIEKKPFYHFLPGSDAFSFATSGCPLRCKFCQNWEISQSRPEDFDSPFVAPAAIVGSASAQQSPSIAFTYNEPTVFMEYLSDIAALAKKQKLRCVMISCGLMLCETECTGRCRLQPSVIGKFLDSTAYAQNGQHRISKGFGIALFAGFAGLSAVIGLEINSGGEAGLLEILGLLALTGFFVSGVFAFAGLRAVSDQRKVITPLYAADLIGGCIGSVLASLALAPLAGLAGTAYWMIPAALLSVLLL